jgi:hypothetical protein
MTREADVTLARANRQALDLLRTACAMLGTVDIRQRREALRLLGRVDETLVAGLELYEAALPPRRRKR